MKPASTSGAIIFHFGSTANGRHRCCHHHHHQSSSVRAPPTNERLVSKSGASARVQSPAQRVTSDSKWYSSILWTLCCVALEGLPPCTHSWTNPRLRRTVTAGRSAVRQPATTLRTRLAQLGDTRTLLLLHLQIPTMERRGARQVAAAVRQDSYRAAAVRYPNRTRRGTSMLAGH